MQMPIRLDLSMQQVWGYRLLSMHHLLDTHRAFYRRAYCCSLYCNWCSSETLPFPDDRLDTALVSSLLFVDRINQREDSFLQNPLLESIPIRPNRQKRIRRSIIFVPLWRTRLSIRRARLCRGTWIFKIGNTQICGRASLIVWITTTLPWLTVWITFIWFTTNLCS